MMEIQDYTSRLKITDYESITNKIKNPAIKEELQKSDSIRSFREQLKKEVSNQIEGKVSSSSVRYPQTIREETERDPYRKKIYNAAVEFESLFVKNMLNEMKKSVQKTGLIDGGYAEEIFDDMLYDEYAKMMSGNGKIGMAEQVYESLTMSL